MKTLLLITTAVALSSCSIDQKMDQAENSEKADYTEQTAQAIIAASYRLGAFILGAAFVRGFMNK